MFCLGACSKGVTPLVILDEGTVGHIIYIETLLPVPLKYGNQVFGSDQIFQQDSTRLCLHYLTQQWCRNNFLSFIDKDLCSPTNPDCNHLDYSICDKLVDTINWDRIKSGATLIQQ